MNNQENSNNGENSESDVHVHFKTEDVMKHESQIQVMEADKGSRDVHLGFLQIHHVYDITFALPHSLGKDVEHDPLESLMVKVKDMTLTDEGHQVKVEFKASKEKLMKEKVTLRSATSDDTLTLTFHARVLGKHKGTPSLRNGIHCVRIEPDEEEESDWQGF